MRAIMALLGRNGSFRATICAGLVSMLGDWVMAVGLSYYIYDLTGSVLASGTMLLANILPRVLLGQLTGVVADRWSRRKLMVCTNLLLAAALTPLLAVDGREDVWVIYTVVLLTGCIEQFFAPAEAALIPQLVEPDQLVVANALNGQVGQLARLVGSVAGGVAVGLGGLGLIVSINILSYLAAVALLLRVREQPFRPAPKRRRIGETVADLLSEWMDGARVAVGARQTRTLLGFAALIGVGEGVFVALIAPFASDVLGGSARDYGILLSMQAVGGIVGAIAVAAVATAVGAHRLLGWGAVLFGLGDLVLFFYPLALTQLWPAFLIIALVGLPAAAMMAGYNTVLQGSVADRHRGRVFGAMTAVNALASLIGTAVGSLVGESVGLIAAISIQGLVLLAGGVLVLARGRIRGPSLRALTTESQTAGF